MIFAKLGRAFALALTLTFGTAGSLLAHALPGTVVTMSQDGTALSVEIAVNVEDLVIAEPLLVPLETMASGHITAPDVIETLARYFEKHMTLYQAGAQVALTLEDARLGTDQNEHVGQFALLTVTFTGQTEEVTPEATMALQYDAVMHEVRNHRAVVIWTDNSNSARTLAEFGFRSVNGQPALVELNAP